MMAKPRINSIPLIFLSSSLVPSYALYFLITGHPIHAPQSIDFWSLLLFLQAWVHAFPWAFRYSLDEINQKFIHQSKLSPTISHHPLCMWNYLLKTPSFPLYPNYIPIYPILFLFKIAFPSLSSFPSPLTVYSDFDSCYCYTLCPIECHLVLYKQGYIIKVHYYYNSEFCLLADYQNPPMESVGHHGWSAAGKSKCLCTFPQIPFFKKENY